MIMTLDRRKFIKTTLAGSAAVAVSGCTSFANANGKRDSDSSNAKLNISFQEGNAPGENINEKFDYMEAHGVVGFEPHGKPLLSRKQEFKDALAGVISR